MIIQIVTLSPQGQITIPQRVRKFFTSRKYVLEIRDEVAILKPCKLMMKAKDSFVNKEIFKKILALNGDEKRVFSHIQKKPCSVDNIMGELHLTVQQVNVLVTELQMSGIIRRKHFGLWESCID